MHRSRGGGERRWEEGGGELRGVALTTSSFVVSYLGNDDRERGGGGKTQWKRLAQMKSLKSMKPYVTKEQLHIAFAM